MGRREGQGGLVGLRSTKTSTKVGQALKISPANFLCRTLPPSPAVRLQMVHKSAPDAKHTEDRVI